MSVSEGLLAALFLNLLAEFGDKTQLAIFALSSRYRRPDHVFLGAFTGEILATALGILVGAYAAQVLPFEWLRLAGGALFLALGAWLLLKRSDAAGAPSARPRAGAFAASLGVIFLAEMGDKSQAANLLLAARYDPLSVFLGSAIALGVLVAAATIVGHKFAASRWAPRVRAFAGVLFIGMGLAALVL
jgi:putative Ca2+/H+ antiporter (TMEM165/GDT1 family)